MKKINIIIISVILLVAGLYFIYSNQKNRQYDLIKPKVGAINEAIYGLGTVMSKEKFSFKIAVPKTVKTLFVHEGENVKKGQKILLFTDGQQVTTPFDGTVFNLPYHAGENAFTDRPVVEVENLKNLYIEAMLDQQSSMRVKVGDAVRISFETIENKYFSGKVDSLYHANGQFVARLDVANLPKEILPGMTADVAVEVAQKDSALLVPVRSVQMGTVLIEREGKREKVNVKLGIMDQEWVEITSDNIKASDFVLVKKAL